MKGILKNMSEDELCMFFAKKTEIMDGFYTDAEGEWKYELKPHRHPYVSEGEDLFVPGTPFDIYMWENK